jgi:hypothetical protein
MMSDLPEPRGRGPSDLEIFDELWRWVKAGIILCFLMSGMMFIAGLMWGFFSRSF